MKLFCIILSVIFIILMIGTHFFLLFFEVREQEIIVRDETKPILKSIARKMNKIIYDKATEYNPQGDFLPDQIDDSIKEKIKDNL